MAALQSYKSSAANDEGKGERGEKEQEALASMPNIYITPYPLHADLRLSRLCDVALLFYFLGEGWGSTLSKELGEVEAGHGTHMRKECDVNRSVRM